MLNIQAPSETKLCYSCSRQIPAESSVCPFCGKSQAAVASKNTGPLNAQSSQPAGVPMQYTEFRASGNIWEIEEREPPMQPDQRRPVLIVDEETILFAHTDKYISPEDLLQRVQSIILHQNVPVEAVLTQARWVNDFYEVRPRVIAYLKDHAFSGLKMVLGLDYMGSWASLQYQIGLQPDPFPQMPPSVSAADPIPIILIVGGVIGGFIGLMMAAAGVDSSHNAGLLFLGILLLIGGVAAVVLGIQMQSKQNAKIGTEERDRERFLREQYEMKSYKARMQLSRTYKIDDMKLFQTAMRVVFQAVVDDIVRNANGEIIKEVKGGRSEFYAGHVNDVTQPQKAVAPSVQSNASQSGV